MRNARDVVVGQVDASQSPEAGERFGWQFGDEILLQAPVNEKGERGQLQCGQICLLSMWLNLQLGGIIRQCNGHTRQTLLTAIDDAIGTATRMGAAVLHAAFHWRMLGETCKCVRSNCSKCGKCKAGCILSWLRQLIQRASAEPLGFDLIHSSSHLAAASTAATT